jgi:DNA modification methylase
LLDTSPILHDLAARIRAEVTTYRKGIEHALAAGDLLIEAQSLMPYGEWGRWLGENCSLSERSAYRYMRLARNRPKLEQFCHSGGTDPDELTLRAAEGMLGPESEAGAGAAATGHDGAPGAGAGAGDADEVGDGDYYTHLDLTAAAREVMGAIDLDPASCRLANEGVQAARVYGVHEDGLKQQWGGRVWLNPPFGDWGNWAPKALDEIRAGRVTEMCVFITANATTGKALKDLKDQADAVMISNGRMNCWGPKATTPPEGNYIFYFGPNVIKFQEVFSRHGTVFLGKGPGPLTLDDEDEIDVYGDGPTPEPELAQPERARHHHHRGLVAEPFYKILQGDVRQLVADLPEVHCVITSPPYYDKITYGDSDREIGHEQSVETYIAGLVAIFKAIPLHPQGSIWVNIGDKRDDGGLLGIPGLFCSAMLANGFRLIDDVVWAKSVATVDGNTIGRVRIESTTDRMNSSGHEPIFRFVKGKDAWTDTFAVQASRYNVKPQRYLPADLMRTVTSLNGRNLSNVWLLSRRNIQENHYGCFPPELVERPVAMTCPPFVNPDGSLPRRLVDVVEYDDGVGRRTIGKFHRSDGEAPYIPRMPVHRGWEEIAADAIPGVVLDPFCGTGTSGEVALKMGRSFIGIELYVKYVEIARKRCAAAQDHVLRNYGYDRVYEMILGGDGGATEVKARRERNRILIRKLIEWDGTMVPIYVEKDRPRYVETKPSVAG